MIYIVDPDATPDDQRHQALTFADDAGWLTFRYITPDRPSVRRYVIEVAEGVEERLPPDEVLPYVRGQAHARGVYNLFPPREDTT